ncbi:HNH ENDONUCLEASE [Salix purpurea]|uniref:HNH ENDONUCLEASE n=1 Tax=Salix purpurea TaxID=77065 RepID=A0A9Q0QGU4_SALPP|nr:HNH ENDONUCLEASE [Salix purpurea]
MAADYAFKEEDMEIDEGVGFPRAYAKLCRDRGAVGAYSHGPPFAFIPYAMQQHEISRARELEQMFPIIEQKAKQTAKPKIFISLLWKQLNHLGNAGFDPAVIRVDPYGNVLYFHADKASPLAWDIDHWGGIDSSKQFEDTTMASVQEKAQQVRVSCSVVGSSAGNLCEPVLIHLCVFQLRFQSVESHSFPQHFIESREKLGLAPAAVVVSRRESYDSSLTLKSLDYNRQMRSHSPANASRKVKPSVLKENEDPDFVRNPYQAIVLARNSLKQKEAAHKMQGEMLSLDDEVKEIKRKNDEEKLSIQDLELTLIKRRRRAEKCRRLAEAQSSYRTMLEKMIRDAMHQSVVYKEQVRLNQAAANALMARLQAQKAICDASEKELHKKYKQRDELEKQIRPDWEQGRKRSRTDDIPPEDGDHKTICYLPGIRPRTPPLHKELRVFLEEEQKASEAGLSAIEESNRNRNEIEEELLKQPEMTIMREEHHKSNIAFENEIPIEYKLRALEIGEGKRDKLQFPIIQDQEIEEDEESRKQRGKGNVERWLQLLLENSGEEIEPQNSSGSGANTTDDIITKLNQKFPLKEAKTQVQGEKPQVILQGNDRGTRVEEIVEIEPNKTPKEKGNGSEAIGSSHSFEGKERIESKKERVLTRSESARTMRRIPSSPSLILGMRNGG